MPLTVRGSQDELADLATDFRDELDTEARGGVQPHLVGQQALWAGMQDLVKEDLESAEMTGFPIVLLILLAVSGSLAAATLLLALGRRPARRLATFVNQELTFVAGLPSESQSGPSGRL